MFRAGGTQIGIGIETSLLLSSRDDRQIRYDLYRGRKDRTLRLATLSGAKLPPHLIPVMPVRTEDTPLHSDAAGDVAAKGYCVFQAVAGD